MVSKLPIVFERTRTIYDSNTCWLLLLLLHLAAVVVVVAVVLLLLGCICCWWTTNPSHGHTYAPPTTIHPFSGCAQRVRRRIITYGQIAIAIHIVRCVRI